ncbi:MAG: efflux RND transporter periplasmic adaptor subunit [Pseudomonadota bacterium]
MKISIFLMKYPAAVLAGALFLGACSPGAEKAAPGETTETEAPGKASLSVELAAVEERVIPLKMSVNGSLAAWQEAIIASQLNGVRIDALRVEVGDTVKKGQTLAVFDQQTVNADLAQARAGVAEAQALFDQAKLNADMIRNITDQGAVSAQERNQIVAAEKSAQARLLSAKALQTQQEIRLRNTIVTALDDGVISARTATLGAVPAPGQELFRLVRQQRLEWQAEVTDAELARIAEGMGVTVLNNDQTLKGKVRTISPVINAQSRTGMVYVDVPGAYAKGLKPGMYLRGEFDLGEQTAVVLPQTAVIERDGFTYAFTLDAATSKVQRIKLRVNKAQGEFIEVLEGLKPGDKVVKSGVAFLAHGDLVKVIQ